MHWLFKKLKANKLRFSLLIMQGINRDVLLWENNQHWNGVMRHTVSAIPKLNIFK